MKNQLTSFPKREFICVLALALLIYGLMLFAIPLAKLLINPASFEAGHARNFAEYAAEKFGSGIRFSYWVGSLLGFLYLWKIKAEYGMSFRRFMTPFVVISFTSVLMTLILAFYAKYMANTIYRVSGTDSRMNEHTFVLGTELIGNVLHFIIIACVFLLAKQIELHLAAKDYRFRWIFQPNSMYDLTPHRKVKSSDDEKEP